MIHTKLFFLLWTCLWSYPHLWSVSRSSVSTGNTCGRTAIVRPCSTRKSTSLVAGGIPGLWADHAGPHRPDGGLPFFWGSARDGQTQTILHCLQECRKGGVWIISLCMNYFPLYNLSFLLHRVRFLVKKWKRTTTVGSPVMGGSVDLQQGELWPYNAETVPTYVLQE